MNHVPTLKKYIMLRDGPTRETDRFLLHDEYLFRLLKLCISCMSLRDFLSWELHVGGLAGHFDQKTIDVVEHKFYWPSLTRDVAEIVGQCRTCQLAKQQKQIAGPYALLLVSNFH